MYQTDPWVSGSVVITEHHVTSPVCSQSVRATYCLSCFSKKTAIPMSEHWCCDFRLLWNLLQLKHLHTSCFLFVIIMSTIWLENTYCTFCVRQTKAWRNKSSCQICFSPLSIVLWLYKTPLSDRVVMWGTKLFLLKHRHAWLAFSAGQWVQQFSPHWNLLPLFIVPRVWIQEMNPLTSKYCWVLYNWSNNPSNKTN